MVTPTRAGVVLVRFPFSDLSRTKLRPAVVLAAVGRGDCLLCQITSRPYADETAIVLPSTAMASGTLQLTSYARPGKLFTGSQDLLIAEVGTLTPQAFAEIVDAVVRLLRDTNSSR